MNQKPHRKFVILKKAHMAGPVTFHNLENAISAISTSPRYQFCPSDKCNIKLEHTRYSCG